MLEMELESKSYPLGPEVHMYELVYGREPVIAHSIGRVWCEETIGEGDEEDAIDFKFVSSHPDGTQYEVPCANSAGVVLGNTVWLKKRDDLLARSCFIQIANTEVYAAMDRLIVAETKRDIIKSCKIV